MPTSPQVTLPVTSPAGTEIAFNWLPVATKPLPVGEELKSMSIAALALFSNVVLLIIGDAPRNWIPLPNLTCA